MIYLVCAIYPEAKGYVEKYNLTRQEGYSSYQVYKNLDYTVIVTGVGKVNAAIAITDFFSSTSLTPNDFLVLIGIAGGMNYSESLFIAREIIDADTRFTYYPDILFSHKLEEATLLTCSAQVGPSNLASFSKLIEGKANVIFDMEASGLYQAAIRYFTCDRIIVIKSISDNVNTGAFARNDFYQFDKVSEVIEQLKAHFSAPASNSHAQELTEKLSRLFSASETMKNDIFKLLAYVDTLNIDSRAFIDSFLANNCITEPVVRKDGKRQLEALHEAILNL